MSDWMTKGCESCRHVVVSGKCLPEVAVSISQHATLRHCPHCGSFWIENEHESLVISESEAMIDFPEAFDGRRRLES
jgi:hypothetical protein